MTNGAGPSRSAAYRPTSLDFINRPNPVEPHAVPEKHPLNGAPRLEQASKEELMRMRMLLEDNNVASVTERPAKKQKHGDATILDLPKLPAVKNGSKRMRIPPTLSGLHQPPPNAGLLPSIVEDQLVRLPNRNAEGDDESARGEAISNTFSENTVDKENNQTTVSETSAATEKAKRKKWTDEETTCLLNGVKQFGIGNWTRILKCADFQFNGRTAIDLKDRFRVCCPKQNGSAKYVREDGQSAKGDSSKSQRRRKGRSEFKKTSIKVEEMDFNHSFQKSKRRPRTTWSRVDDIALLQGYNRYGNSWASIQEDPELDLGSRKPTDLRDRFRTRYPEYYRKAGLAPRPEAFPKKPERCKPISNDRGSSQQDKSIKPQTEPVENPPEPKILPQREKGEREQSANQAPTRPKLATVFPTTLLPYDDVFFGAPFADEDQYFTRPTLDRTILDESFDLPKASTSTGIGSLETHDTASSRNFGTSNSGSSVMVGLGTVSGGTLPSVAAITSGVDDFADQLELPELIGAFGTLDDVARGGGHFPSLEDLLG